MKSDRHSIARYRLTPSAILPTYQVIEHNPTGLPPEPSKTEAERILSGKSMYLGD